MICGTMNLYSDVLVSYEGLKFKRRIIITDGWDNDDNFMNYAITITNNEILNFCYCNWNSIKCNIILKFSKLLGCNYFIATKEEDWEKDLILQSHYMTFVFCFLL